MDEYTNIITRAAQSMVAAYQPFPWGEELDLDECRKFMNAFYESKNGLAMYDYRVSQNQPPYLYIGIERYGNQIEKFIHDEFSKDTAFFHAASDTEIRTALQGVTNMIYIANIHADKTFAIPSDFKPRLKVLPGLIEKLFIEEGVDAVTLYTHRETGVFRAIHNLDKTLYEVTVVDYDVDKMQAVVNENSHIDHLVFVLVRRK
jgi:hypothetical protein